MSARGEGILGVFVHDWALLCIGFRWGRENENVTNEANSENARCNILHLVIVTWFS